MGTKNSRGTLCGCLSELSWGAPIWPWRVEIAYLEQQRWRIPDVEMYRKAFESDLPSTSEDASSDTSQLESSAASKSDLTALQITDCKSLLPSPESNFSSIPLSLQPSRSILASTQLHLGWLDSAGQPFSVPSDFSQLSPLRICKCRSRYLFRVCSAKRVILNDCSVTANCTSNPSDLYFYSNLQCHLYFLLYQKQRFLGDAL
jgi:hypothetical protein